MREITQMKKQILLFFLLQMFSIFSIFCQNISISGKIIDTNTKKAIPYANVSIERTGFGTVSNYDGAFTLKLPGCFKNKQLTVSYMGYNTYKILVANISNNLTIRLKKTDILLQEVTVFPDSTLLDLLRKAYNSINKNYSQKPTLYEGFFRETLKTDSNQYLYFSEANIKTYKNSYKNSSDYGQVKILKSRKNIFPGSDTINNVKFYAGIYSANTNDIVKNRRSFINPKKFKNYHYELNYITKLNGKNVYVISFDTKNDSLKGNYSGTLYIDKKSLAYIQVDYMPTKRGIKKINKKASSHPFMKRQSSNCKVIYTKFNDNWHIKYVFFNIYIINSKYNSNLFYTKEYLTTKIQTDSVKPIPYSEQISFTDIFLDKSTEYDKSFWKDYNVIEQDSVNKQKINLYYSNNESKKLLKTKQEVKPTTRDKILKIASKINFSYGISYIPLNSNGGNYNFTYFNNTNNEIFTISKNIDPFEQVYFLENEIQYKITKNLGLDFNFLTSLNKNSHIDGCDFGITYRTPIKQRGKPIFINASLVFSNNGFYKKLDDINNDYGDFKINNKKINADKLTVFIGDNYLGLKPKVTISRRIGRFIELTFNAAYLLDFNHKEQIVVEEKSGFFLTRKTAKKDIENSNINLLIDNNQTYNNQIYFDKYYFGMGLLFGIGN